VASGASAVRLHLTLFETVSGSPPVGFPAILLPFISGLAGARLTGAPLPRSVEMDCTRRVLPDSGFPPLFRESPLFSFFWPRLADGFLAAPVLRSALGAIVLRARFDNPPFLCYFSFFFLNCPPRTSSFYCAEFASRGARHHSAPAPSSRCRSRTSRATLAQGELLFFFTDLPLFFLPRSGRSLPQETSPDRSLGAAHGVCSGAGRSVCVSHFFPLSERFLHSICCSANLWELVLLLGWSPVPGVTRHLPILQPGTPEEVFKGDFFPSSGFSFLFPPYPLSLA